MSLRKIDISRLMDAYEDLEFLPEEDVQMDMERVRREIINSVKGKRRTARRTALVAAVLAACLALAGWTYGEQIYRLISGQTVTVGGDSGMGSVTVEMSDGRNENGDPAIIALEEGRLWFVAGGERIDVTNLVDEETPYVWTQRQEDGSLHYIIAGGTPEDYGWFEGMKFPDGSGGGSGTPHSRTDLSQAEQLEEPDWYTAGREQVEELWEN